MKRQALFTGTCDPFHIAHAWQLERAYGVQPFDGAPLSIMSTNQMQPPGDTGPRRTDCRPTIRRFKKEYLEHPKPVRIVGADSIIEFAEDQKHWPVLADFDYIVVMRPAITEGEVAAVLERLPKGGGCGT